MVSNAGTIEAQLILNASQFQKQMQAAMASAQNMGKGLSSNLSNASKSLSGATSEVTRFHQRLGEAKSFATALGNTVSKQAKQIQAAFSKILPGDALAKQFNLGSRAILTMADEARKTNAQFRQLSAAATSAGKSAKNAFPIEYIEKTSNAMRKLNQQVITASSSYAATGRSFLASTNQVNSGVNKTSSIFQRVGSVGSAAFGKVSSGIMTAGNSLASLTNSVVSFNVWMGALVGAAFYQFTVGAAMAVEESKSLFKFVGMGVAEVERLDVATAKYAESASKVSQPEMLSAWRLVRLSHKMSADQMIQYNSTLGDTIGLFKANGRSAEDAGRAIEDAMAGGSDGIKRMKEIGISDMQELYDRGFDKSKPETFFAALQKLYEDKGIAGYGSKVTSLADRFENLKEKIQLAGIAAGEALMPGMEALVNGLTAIFEGLGPQISGAIIAFTGLATILGFFWPTLVAIGSGASHAAGKILELAGGTLKYKTAANGAKTSSIAWGDTLGGLNKRMIAAAAGVGIMVAALVGLAYYMSQANSASVAWAQAEDTKNEKVDLITKNNQILNGQISELVTKRNEEAAAGRSTADIDSQIASARQKVTDNTNAAAQAERDYKNAQAMKGAVESAGETRITSAKTSAAAAKEGKTPEQYIHDTGNQAEYNDALFKTAKLQRDIQGPYDKMAGTIDKINKGTDTYSTKMKKAYDGKYFEEYKNDYDAFAKSSENFFKAQEEGDIGKMIWFGVESGVLQARVGLKELQMSIWSWAEDIGAAIKKPFQDAYVGIQKWWDGLPGWFGGLGNRIGQLWGETVSYIQGAWGNTVAFFQGAWNNTVAWIQNGLNWISSGFSAAGAWIQGAWNNTVNFLRIMWDYAVNYVMTRWNAAVWAVTGNPLVARLLDWASGAMERIKGAWRSVVNFVASLPIVGQFIQSGGPSVPGRGSGGGGGSAFGPPLKGTKSFLNMASGFTYLPYGGIGQSISQTLSNFAGNCVDGSLAQIALANAWGIPAELIQSTWMGNPHVYARIGGQDRDIANHALTGSWRAPPRGPSGGNGGNTYIFNAPVYNWKEFKKDVAKANDQIVKNY